MTDDLVVSPVFGCIMEPFPSYIDSDVQKYVQCMQPKNTINTADLSISLTEIRHLQQVTSRYPARDYLPLFLTYLPVRYGGLNLLTHSPD